MKKIFLSVIFSICTIMMSYSQPIWSELGGANSLVSNSPIIFDISSDNFGNIYACGDFKNSSNNGFVAKWDGSFWSELGGFNSLSANGIITSICTDALGNVYAGDILQICLENVMLQSLMVQPGPS
ncbi:MAG: hypothetical protein IPJ79_05605 [Bacteroidetes bacterium]|nr:hypothetical protein [Bacteroidota bacterium]